LSRTEALTLGALMNCRGVTELVVATVGAQQHLLSTLGRTMLVLTALVTTAVTGPLVRVLAPRPPVRPVDLAAGVTGRASYV
jgi:K+:H+ antiporter